MEIQVISVPSEAGTHFAGQSKAPNAVVEQGKLIEKLKKIGYKISASNALASDMLRDIAAWKASPVQNGVRNEDATIKTLQAVRSHIEKSSSQKFPIIIGGDCTISIACLAGLTRWHPPDTRIGLLYFDGDADFTLPSDTGASGTTGILDSMTLTHLTARKGGLESMWEFSHPGHPLITKDNIVLFGFDPEQPRTEHWTYMLETGFKVFTRPTVQRAPSECALHALEWLKQRVDIVYLHFDVDVIDSATFPLANYPHYNGLDPAAGFEALRTIVGDAVVKGMILTEINPNNDPDGSMIDRVTETLAQGFKNRADVFLKERND